MRVLFVFPDLSATVTDYSGVLNYGIGILTACLRRDGHDVSLYHITRPPTEAEFTARLREARPDLVAFSSNSHYARRLGEWSAWARAATGAPVVVGGIHASLAPEEVAAIPAVDFTCIGEGEATLSELCRTLEAGGDPGGITGLWVRRDGVVVRNPNRAITEDLDTLPDPDFSVFDFDALYPVRQGTFTYIMSRGCAYKCTYCCASTLRHALPRTGSYWRFLGPERAVRQLRALIDRYMPGARDVSFVDAIMFPNDGWLEAFAPLYRARIGLPFSCNMRADRIRPRTAELLRGMGCRIVRMGVESGNQRITSEVLARRLDLDHIRRAFALLRAHGIERWSYNMVGLPTETLPLALETVRLNAEIDPDLALAFIFYPYPGTRLHEMTGSLGCLTDEELDHYQVGMVTRMPVFERDDVMFVHRHFKRLVRLYGWARRLPAGPGRVWTAALDRTLASRWFPRRAVVRGRERYRRARHRAGEFLVRRAPALYRLLGGRAPSLRPAPASGWAPCADPERRTAAP